MLMLSPVTSFIRATAPPVEPVGLDPEEPPLPVPDADADVDGGVALGNASEKEVEVEIEIEAELVPEAVTETLYVARLQNCCASDSAEEMLE